MEGVRPVFTTPIACYENKELVSDLKKYILSKKINGIQSNVSTIIKQNLDESTFDFFMQDVDIIKRSIQWFANCLQDTINSIHNNKTLYNFKFNENA